MQGNQVLGYWMEVTRPDWNFVFVIYYLISKLFDSKGSCKTVKHYILLFRNRPIFDRTQAACFFFHLFRGQNTRAENPVSCPWLSRWPWTALLPQSTDACCCSLIAGIGDKGRVLVSLTHPTQMNSVHFSVAHERTSLAWLETKKSV